MRLVRLLSAGKALVTLRDAPTAYRVRPDARLPRFGGGKNPFQKQEAVTVTPPEETKPSAGSPGRRMQRWTAWLRRWWPAAKCDLPRRSEVGVPVTRYGRARQPATVQGELRLKEVKVVRNDLLDSDLDVVAPDGKSGAAKRMTARLWRRAAVAERTLDRLAARLAGVPPR